MNGWDSKPNGWEKIDFDYTVNIDINLINDLSINLNKLEKSEGIFVLAGGIDKKGICHPWVQKRLLLAFKLYKILNVPIYCIGGGSYHIPPIRNKYNYVIHESTSCAEFLIKLGVNPEHIYKEWSSYDTSANGYFSFTNFILPKKISNMILITSEFHMLRSQEIFNWIKDLFNCNVEINYYSVSDKGLDIDLINIRSKREKDSHKNIINLREKINNLNDFHKWMFTEHKAYSSNSELIRKHESIDEETKMSY